MILIKLEDKIRVNLKTAHPCFFFMALCYLDLGCKFKTLIAFYRKE